MADEIELQPHPSGSQQHQQHQDDQAHATSSPRGFYSQIAPVKQRQTLFKWLQNYYYVRTHSVPLYDEGTGVYSPQGHPDSRIDDGEDKVPTDSQQTNQHPHDAEPLDEPLSWNLPTKLMKWEYMREYCDRTGSNVVVFGAQTLRAEKHGKLDAQIPILCARKRPWNHIVLDYEVSGVAPVERQLGPTYLILGVFSSQTTIPYEICIPIWPRHDLALAIRRGTRTLRGVGGIFSLKYVSGFTIYQCHDDDGFHSRVELDMRTENTLAQLYADSLGYSGRDKDTHFNFIWKPWIHVRLNSKTYEPENGRYSLELKLSWSPFRIVALASTPIVLSLAIGLWYMETSEKPEVAWVIATYIATAGGVLVAIIAAVVALRQQ